MSQLLTLAEYTTAPTAVATSDLVRGGTQADQDAALTAVIRRATGWMENFVNQPLVATTTTVTGQIRVSANSEVILAPGLWPLRSLTSLALGTNGADLASVADLTPSWIDNNTFVVPPTWPVAGGAIIQLGTPIPTRPALARYAFVSGYVNTTLTAPATLAATTVTVASYLGVAAGATLTIADGPRTEDVTVTATPTSTTVTISATAFTHAAGVAIHACPEDLKQAAILTTTAMLRTRGNTSMVMGQTLTPGQTVGQDPVGSADLRVVREILNSYRRVR